eukprot:m.14788 g.14788  ORF g.14788 m.14788 type:complete len:1118 (-) comp10283_c0_seq1:34-3387(-)
MATKKHARMQSLAESNSTINPYKWLSACLCITGLAFGLFAVYLYMSNPDAMYLDSTPVKRKDTATPLSKEVFRAISKDTEEDSNSTTIPHAIGITTTEEPDDDIENQDIVKEHREKIAQAKLQIQAAKNSGPRPIRNVVEATKYLLEEHGDLFSKDVSHVFMRAPRNVTGLGFAKTWPTVTPDLTTNEAFINNPKYKSTILKLGNEAILAFNTVLSADKHKSQHVYDATAEDRALVMSRLPDAKTKKCTELDPAVLTALAEGFISSTVDSRFWACLIIFKLIGRSEQEEASELGFEKMFRTTEYRFFVRDMTRYGIVNSQATCTRFWGTSASFLGAGVYGLGYLRCSDVEACASRERSVIKVAGVVPWEKTRRKGLLQGLPPWALETQIQLSASSLTLGYDTSPESFYNEALRAIVGASISPNIGIGYGTWVCDDFQHMKTGGVLPPNLKCRGYKGDDKEMKAACTVIISDIEHKDMSQNMQIMAQEEVEVSINDVWKNIYDAYKDKDLIWSHSNKAMLFQIIYTIHAMQETYPGIRHNDFSWYNIRSTVPSSIKWENKLPSGKTSMDGLVHAPLANDQRAETFYEYTANNKVFKIPNYGFQVRICDFDFMHTPGFPRANNPKVTKIANRVCAVRTPEEVTWTPIHDKVLSERFVPLTTNPDSKTFVDHMGLMCAKWKGKCQNFSVGESDYDASDWATIVDNCPNACGRPSFLYIDVDASKLSQLAPYTDDPKFRDYKGYTCQDWKSDSYGCLRSGTVHEYPPSQRANLLSKCPKACRTENIAEAKTVLVHLERSACVQDGVYKAEVVARFGNKWSLKLELNSTRGAIAARLRQPALFSNSNARVRFFVLPWFEVYSLKKTRNDDSLKFETILNGRTGPPQVHSSDIIRLLDNRVGITESFRVRTVYDSLGTKWVLPRSSPSESPFPKNCRRISLDSRRVLGEAKTMHEDKSLLVGGGFGYVSGLKSSQDYFDYAGYGITPENNTRFDLHFMFNLLLDHVIYHSQKKYAHPTAIKFIQGLFPASNPLIARGDSTRTYDFRVTDYFHHWWCVNQGLIGTDHPIIRDFPSPQDMLNDPYFAEYTKNGGGGVAQAATNIGRFSVENKLPADLHLGTGALT